METEVGEREMVWKYEEVADDSVDTVITKVTERLNKLNKGTALKFDVSNAQRSLARGIIFYGDGLASAARSLAAADPGGAPAISWNEYTWHSGDDYPGMYKGFADALNGEKLPNGTYLSRWQVEHARPVFTNAHDREATLSLFYPSE